MTFNPIFRFTILCLALFVCSQVNAQHHIGVKASYGYTQSRGESRLTINGEQAVNFDLRFINAGPSSAFGMMSQHNFGWLWLQPELLYSRFEQEYSVRSFTGSDENLFEQFHIEKHSYFDVSVMGGLRFNRFRYGVGPIFHITGSINSDLDQYEFFTQDPRWITYGFQGGIGYDFDYIHVDFKFESTFRAAGDHIKFTDTRVEQYNNQLQVLSLSLGFMF